MCRAGDTIAAVLAAALAATGSAPAQDSADRGNTAPAPNALRVCADPNNLPFSNDRREGFENELAELVARDLGRTVDYTWWAQRRGFVRMTLKGGQCDLVMGVPVHYDLVETTKPYYRSTYVFVSRADRKLDISSLKDPRLRAMSIGVHLIGNDATNTPPAHALGAEGLTANTHGYMIYGDYRNPDPPADLISAVERGDVDIATAWGPLAGFAAKRSSVALAITPISDTDAFAPLRFHFDIAMGVRKGDHALKAQLDEVIEREQAKIDALLQSYGVPLVKAQIVTRP
jgi:quinoprotein dehydrogenase-associated probable ABC transporter substrate-binding protein